MDKAAEGGNTVVLVSCVGEKLQNEALAQDLYRSAWFKKARRYAEATGDSWYVLSAEHHLLEPTTKIHPYETTLNRMNTAAREAWASTVLEQIRTRIDLASRVVILAGTKYRERIVPVIESWGYLVEVPMKGLGIGQQLAWLDENSPATTPLPAISSPRSEQLDMID